MAPVCRRACRRRAGSANGRKGSKAQPERNVPITICDRAHEEADCSSESRGPPSGLRRGSTRSRLLSHAITRRPLRQRPSKQGRAPYFDRTAAACRASLPGRCRQGPSDGQFRCFCRSRVISKSAVPPCRQDIVRLRLSEVRSRGPIGTIGLDCAFTRRRAAPRGASLDRTGHLGAKAQKRPASRKLNSERLSATRCESAVSI